MVDGKHPALVSEELFQAAQEKRGSAPRLQSRRELTNPFAGLCKCECGAAMVLKPCGKAQLRIMCQHQTHCHNKSALYVEFEEEVVRILRSTIAELAAQYESGEDPAVQMQENLLAGLRQELIEIEQQQEKLYDLLERGIYTEPVFLQRNAALAERRRAVQDAVAKASAKVVTRDDIRERIVRLTEAVDCIHNEDLPPKTKNELLRTVIGRIRYSRQMDRYDKSPFTLNISFDY